ncbi:MAG TPA: extracellular solute-binding protein [Cyanophyceae cyanobacterium]
MKRRSFLVGTSALALSQLASGCSSQQASLRVQLLKNSIPAQLVGGFRRTLKQSAVLKFDPAEQLDDLFTLLNSWKQQAKEKDSQQSPFLPFLEFIPFIPKKTPRRADLVTLGHYWLDSAIQEQLIQPLKIEDLKAWQQLPNRWQQLVKRDSQGQRSDSGLIWGAPYRWGTTVIAYDSDKFKELGWTPKDWSDLWRPELRDRISLLDQPREGIGLVLKKLGYSYNTTNLNQVSKLKEELQSLHRQAKFYSSNHYLEPLVLGDTWLAVGWSTDVLSAQSTYRQIEFVVPESGTALWADLWVQPISGANPSNSAKIDERTSLMKQWIDFCWQPKSAIEISLFAKGISPAIANINPKDLTKNLRENSLLLPDSPVFEKSEFLQPLPQPAMEQYEALWNEIRLN